ncbi:hypothetical protein VA596_03715 [Amycolatopsis sp., V23-08]|uniref:Uncharacterized protein n=1 Tax=Amycolatopsis heterodermiae TaxID=3110235 RepID=A0ABU5QXI1_9PSEU|nr:hypothetical protein [Amycolatopsis sp., V23-08]MEA5358631.1 hypothetical protein [Amycolatopsis sp., V23-08]
MITEAEVGAARKWLAKRGVEAEEPTTLLALRLGARGGARPPAYWAWFVVLAAALLLGDFVLVLLPVLLGVARADRFTGSWVFPMCVSFVLLGWLPVRRADRRAAVSLGGRRLDVPRPSWRESMNGWYRASVVITFGGGAVVAVALCVATSRWLWALTWLVLLALSAIVVAVVLNAVLRRPVIAEDDTSLRIDAVLRAEDPFVVMPALFALPVLIDPVLSGWSFTPWLVGYVVLAFATLFIGRYVQYRHRKLPAGDYGTSVVAR